MENTESDSQKTKKNEKLKKGARKTAEKEHNESDHSQDKKEKEHNQEEQSEEDKSSRGKRKAKKTETSQKKQKIEEVEEWIEEPFYEGTTAHYRGCIVEGESYFLNDAVQLKSPEGDKPYVGRIVSLWASTKGKGAKKKTQSFCKIQWFYRMEDLPKSLKAKSDGERHIFSSDHFDDNHIGSIMKKCHIQRSSDIPDLQQYISHDDHYYFDKLFKEEDVALIDV